MGVYGQVGLPKPAPAVHFSGNRELSGGNTHLVAEFKENPVRRRLLPASWIDAGGANRTRSQVSCS